MVLHGTENFCEVWTCVNGQTDRHRDIDTRHTLITILHTPTMGEGEEIMTPH